MLHHAAWATDVDRGAVAEERGVGSCTERGQGSDGALEHHRPHVAVSPSLHLHRLTESAGVRGRGCEVGCHAKRHSGGVEDGGGIGNSVLNAVHKDCVSASKDARPVACDLERGLPTYRPHSAGQPLGAHVAQNIDPADAIELLQRQVHVVRVHVKVQRRRGLVAQVQCEQTAQCVLVGTRRDHNGIVDVDVGTATLQVATVHTKSVHLAVGGRESHHPQRPVVDVVPLRHLDCTRQWSQCVLQLSGADLVVQSVGEATVECDPEEATQREVGLGSDHLYRTHAVAALALVLLVHEAGALAAAVQLVRAVVSSELAGTVAISGVDAAIPSSRGALVHSQTDSHAVHRYQRRASGRQRRQRSHVLREGDHPAHAISDSSRRDLHGGNGCQLLKRQLDVSVAGIELDWQRCFALERQRERAEASAEDLHRFHFVDSRRSPPLNLVLVNRLAVRGCSIENDLQLRRRHRE